MYFLSLLTIFFILIKGETVNETNTRPSCENFTNFHVEPGYQPHPTIIGGYVASIEEFPFALRLYIRLARKIAFCSGQAVTRTLVLTAAHCVALAQDLVLVGGKADHNDYVRGITFGYARYKAKEVFVHPEYDGQHFRHDVAIIKTGRPIGHRGHAFVKLSYERINDTVSVHIFGWGETEKGTNDILYGKHVRAVNCSLAMGTGKCHEYICLEEKGIGHGDSGGGLLKDGIMYGVASFYTSYDDDCSPGKYSYYFASLWAEKQFVKDCIDKNGSNYNRLFFNFTWVFLFYLFIR